MGVCVCGGGGWVCVWGGVDGRCVISVLKSSFQLLRTDRRVVGLSLCFIDAQNQLIVVLYLDLH